MNLFSLTREHVVTGKALRSAVWENTALDHRRARLWVCLAFWVRLFGRARLLLFGLGSLGEHGSCPSGPAEHGSGSPGIPQFCPYSAINSRLFSKPQIYKTLCLFYLFNTTTVHNCCGFSARGAFGCTSAKCYSTYIQGWNKICCARILDHGRQSVAYFSLNSNSK